jgi:hypothetical protein
VSIQPGQVLDRLKLDPLSDKYIPHARDVIVGWSVRYGQRTYCTVCEPTGTEPIYGGKEGEVDGECDRCHCTFADRSRLIEVAHDEQQRRWGRESRIEYVIEMGATAAIRCRVY